MSPENCVFGALIQDGERKWNKTVLRIAGCEIDFGIEHTYLPTVYGETPVKQANFYVYQLYNEHFGDTLIATRASCGQWDVPGGARVRPRSGRFKLFAANLLT